MKLHKILAASLLLMGVGFGSAADNCELFIQVVPPAENPGDLPFDVSELLTNRLVRAVSADGVVASPDYGQLYLTARCADVYKSTLAGPPTQTVVNTELTLAVADIGGGTVFATKTFDLRGVGTSEQRAYINALQQLSGRNSALASFIADAKVKTIAYFNRNYKSLLSKAQRAASMRDYEQALYYSTLIPECCVGFAEAEAATQKYYQGYVDYTGTMLLNQAKAAFATSPNAAGAAEAYALLAQIDPQSAAYKASESFAAEVKKQTKAEYDFEVHKKYEDSMALERQRLSAARDVGVAYGRGQKNTTTNILWK